jgi:phospholipase C
MKFAVRSLFVLIALAATLAHAQTLHHFDHIIIVFQENRTPDNLFGSGPAVSACNTDDPFEPGVDIRNCVNHYGVAQYFQPLHLNDPEDPGHGHRTWTTQCNANSSGVCQMDGTCGDTGWQKCYSYVYRADVEPYFDIAKSYGFANYMFQTNQGPSFPAHQFIFAGTSAPVPYNDPSGQWTWFVADNPDGITGAGDNTGCTTLITQPNEFALTIDPTG